MEKHIKFLEKLWIKNIFFTRSLHKYKNYEEWINTWFVRSWKSPKSIVLQCQKLFAASKFRKSRLTNLEWRPVIGSFSIYNLCDYEWKLIVNTALWRLNSRTTCIHRYFTFIAIFVLKVVSWHGHIKLSENWTSYTSFLWMLDVITYSWNSVNMLEHCHDSFKYPNADFSPKKINHSYVFILWIHAWPKTSHTDQCFIWVCSENISRWCNQTCTL